MLTLSQFATTSASQRDHLRVVANRSNGQSFAIEFCHQFLAINLIVKGHGKGRNRG